MTPHELLLALAGRVDDDLLGWARELVAAGEDARAIELVTATLVADRTPVPGPIREALVDACRTAGTDLDAATALPPASSEDGPLHRFERAADPAVETAVRGLPAHQIQGCRVLLTARLTPAGTAPGPLPHPVVLVEVAGGPQPPAVLGHQLAVSLEQVGVRAGVEVLTAGRPVSAYHAAALQDASPVHDDGRIRDDRASAPVRAVADDPVPLFGGGPSDGAVPELFGGSAHPLARSTERGAAPEPAKPETGGPETGGPEPGRPEPQAPAPARRPTVTPISRAVPMDPAPAAVARPEASDLDATIEHPAVPLFDRPDPDPVGGAQHRAHTDTPTFAEMQDPLLGPLSTPLLDPLLDPTIGTSGDVPPTPGASTPRSTAVDAGWAADWASGSWAMPPSALTDRDPAGTAPDGTEAGRAGSEPPASGRRRSARHRSAEEPDASTGPVAGPGPAVTPDSPAHPPIAPHPFFSEPSPPRPVDPGLPPDHAPPTTARLSDTDRELLARLQSGLAAGPRPRTDEEPGATNGSTGPSGTAPQPRID